MTDNTTPYPELPPPTKTEQRLYSAAESFWDAASMRAYVDADRAARAGDAEPVAEQALLKVLAAVQCYLPPDGSTAKETLSEIIAIVDPWPLTAAPQAPERERDETRDEFFARVLEEIGDNEDPRLTLEIDVEGHADLKRVTFEIVLVEVLENTINAALAASREGGAK